jgi:hypothetical protein
MIRQDILNAMRERFTAISTGNGYNYNVAKCTLSPVIPEPRLVNLYVGIIDRGQEIIKNNFGSNGPEDMILDVDVETKIRISKTMQEPNYTLAHGKMVADIRKAAGVDDTWGGKALLTNYIQDKTDIQFGDAIIVQSIISFKIQFRVSRWSN